MALPIVVAVRMGMLPKIPDDLQSAINIAHQAMHADLEYSLRPYYRSQIYRLLDWQTRGILAVLTVRRYLSIWYRVQPNDPLPEDWLTTAENFIYGRIPREQMEQQHDIASWITCLDGISPEMKALGEKDWHASSILQAAAEALSETLQLYGFDGLDLAPDETDSKVDPWTTDTALWVAVACAGRSWVPGFDPIKRRAFWTWWLKDALPLAWTLIHEPREEMKNAYRSDF